MMGKPSRHRFPKQIWFGFLILLLFFANCQKPAQMTTQSEEALLSLQQGDQLRLRFDLTNALEAYQKAIRSDPQFAIAYLRSADMQISLGHADSAKIYLTRARELSRHSSDYERWIIQYAWAEFRQDNLLSQATFDTLSRRFPNDLQVKQYWAYRQWNKNDFKGAIQTFQEILKQQPNYIIAYNNIGYLYAKRGLLKEALVYLKKYKDFAPDQLNPYDSVAEIYLLIGRYQEAIQIIEAAFSAKPDELRHNRYLGTVMHLRLAEAYIRLGHYSKALEITQELCDTYLMSQPVKQVAAFRFKQIFKSLHQPDKMKSELDCLLPLCDDIEKLYYQCLYAIENSDLPTALYIISSIQTKSKTEEVYYKKHAILVMSACLEGQLNYKNAMYQEAADQFALAAATIGDTSLAIPYRFEQYQALGQAGKYTQAIKGLSKLLSINPNYAPALLCISEFYAVSGFKPEARTYLAHFRTLWKDADPDTPLVIRADELTRRLF